MMVWLTNTERQPHWPSPPRAGAGPDRILRVLDADALEALAAPQPAREGSCPLGCSGLSL